MSVDAFGESETWIALLLGDASFPGGSLANSQGLESAVLHDVVRKNGIDTLQVYIDLSIEQVSYQTLPFVRTAHSLISSAEAPSKQVDNDEKHRFYTLDQYCHAFLSNDVSRRASINQGRCFLRVIKESFPPIAPFLDDFMSPPVNSSSNPRPAHIHVHFAPVFGLVCKLLNISMGLTDRVFLRMFLRDLVSAGIRLNLIGPIEGVRLQVESFSKLEMLGSPELCVDRQAPPILLQHNNEDTNPLPPPYLTHSGVSARKRRVCEFYMGIAPVQSAPVIDILQSRHDLLYSRLFNS